MSVIHKTDFDFLILSTIKLLILSTQEDPDIFICLFVKQTEAHKVWPVRLLFNLKGKHFFLGC